MTQGHQINQINLNYGNSRSTYINLAIPVFLMKRGSFGSVSTTVSGGLSSDIQTSEGEDGARSLLIPRDTTDFLPESGSDSLPSFHSAVQVTPGVGIVHPSFGHFLSTFPPMSPGPHFRFITVGISRCYPQYYVVFMMKTDFIMILFIIKIILS